MTDMTDSSKVAASSWVTKVEEFDVLMGRGKRSYNHSGNLRFRDLVVRFAPDYQASQSKPQRKAMAVEIMNAVERSGGRFLKPIDSDKANQGALAGRWEVVPKHIVRTKVKQALRDMPTFNAAAKHEDDKHTQPIFKQALASQRSVARSDKPAAQGPTAGIGHSVNTMNPATQLHGAQGSGPTFSFQGVGGDQIAGGAAAIACATSMQQLANQMAGLPTNNALIPRQPQQLGSTVGGTAGSSGTPGLGMPGALTPADIQSLQLYLAAKQTEEQLARVLQQQNLLQQQAASPPGNLLDFLQASNAVARHPIQPSQGMGLLGSAISGGFGEALGGGGRLPTQHQGGVATQSILQALLNQQQQQHLRSLNFQGQLSTVPAVHGPTNEGVDPARAYAAVQDSMGNASYGVAASPSVGDDPNDGEEQQKPAAGSGTSSNRTSPSNSQTAE